MTKNKAILYIGNDLTKKSKYNSTMETLSQLLRKEKFTVYKSSSNRNKIFRLIEMCLSVIMYRNKIAYVLIDTFSTTNFYYAFVTSQLSRIFGIKYIPIIHGGNLPHRIATSKFFSKLIFKYSYKNVAPSGYLKHEFEKRGYTSVLIPNVITIEDYKFKERKILKPKLLYVRAFAAIYNPTMAVEVLSGLKKIYPMATLCMIGPDKDGTLEKVKHLAANLKLLDSIEFTGVLTQKEWHLKSEGFDVFINTTNVDNTPLSVIEAMALGLPIVSTNAGGLSYLLDNGTDAILVDKGDASQMINSIDSLLKGEGIKLAKKARLKAESFDWLRVKEKWFSILK